MVRKTLGILGLGVFLLIALLAQDHPYDEGQKVEEIEVIQEKDQEVKELLEQEKIDKWNYESISGKLIGDRPNIDGGPTLVKVGMFIDDIPIINSADQTFYATVSLSIRWNDPRLKTDVDQIRKFKRGEIWDPLARIVNIRDVTEEIEEDFFVDKDGSVFYIEKLHGTFTFPLNHENFPFEDHQLALILRSFFSPEDVQFVIDESMTGWSG